MINNLGWGGKMDVERKEVSVFVLNKGYIGQFYVEGYTDSNRTGVDIDLITHDFIPIVDPAEPDYKNEVKLYRSFIKDLIIDQDINSQMIDQVKNFLNKEDENFSLSEQTKLAELVFSTIAKKLASKERSN